MTIRPACSIVVGPLVVLTAVGGLCTATDAAGLNTNVALTPPLDGTILRYQ